MICKNCGSSFEGNFCNQCGQKNIDERITLKEILHAFFHNFTHLDSGILYLARELFIRPGIVAKEYIEGKRKKYFNPFQYLIIVVALSTFLTLNYDLLGPKTNPASLSDPNDNRRFMAVMNNFFYGKFNLILFFSVPISAFFSWIFFKKSGYNYSENLIFNTFITAQRIFFFILISPLMYFTSGRYWYIGVGTYYAFWLIYFCFAFIQFYGESKVKTILKFTVMSILMIGVSQAIAIGFIYLFIFK